MEDTSKNIIKERLSENSVSLNKTLSNYQLMLYSLTNTNDIFWLKNWSTYTDIEKINNYANVSKRIRSIKADNNIINVYLCYLSGQWNSLSESNLNLFIKTDNSNYGNIDITEILMACKIGFDVDKIGFAVMGLDHELITRSLRNIDGYANVSIYVENREGEVVY